MSTPAGQQSSAAITVAHLLEVGRDRAAIADLARAALGDDSVHLTVYKVTRDAPEADLPAHEAGAALFGVWHHLRSSTNPGEGSFGAYAARLHAAATQNGQFLTTETRFEHLLKLPPSWETLIDDLCGWDEHGKPVQHRWATDFWRPTA